MKIGKENFFIIEKIITIIVMVLIVFLSNSSYANDNQTIIEQQEEFKIKDFIKNIDENAFIVVSETKLVQNGFIK